MNDYNILFQDRANNYHLAMQEYPNVRIHEFKSLISSTNFSDLKMVLDIPSGGGYLKNHLPDHVNIISTDFSEGFKNDDIKLVSPEKLPFESNSFDAIFSLSGMHHLNNVPLFVEECLRILKKDRNFVFADVKKDSNVDFFLNNFLNEYSSLGHKGDFFYQNYFEKHSNIQNKIIDCQYNEYPFLFNDETELIRFFKLFFGLDKASDIIILEGVRDILGIEKTSKGLEVNWGLIQYTLKK
ncbi:MAG: class I SAM-dependent methyltransferase [Bacteroidota bacterium]